MTRVLIADDHPLFRRALKDLIASLPDMEVVGEAATGGAVLEQALAARPDVVVMDLKMPEVDGIEATRRLTDAIPEVAVLVLTMHEDDDSVFAAMRAGARGYLLKGAEQEEIVRAIEAVSSGQAIFGPGVAQRVVQYFSAGPASHPEPFPELTPREREVLELISSGESNAVIARRLRISSKTVSNHISVIFTKLQVADRAQAIVQARRAGLGRRFEPGGPRA
jgi:DNA-binding NarL/FixJ family response regulator